jgi:serine/threonine protein kinase
MQGRQVAGYVLGQPLGNGGVGSVYKALSPSGATVAIKILNAASQDCEQTRRRFLQEFEVARRLVHPHIVRYLDFGTDADLQYIAMEYVEGESLWGRVRRQGPMPEADVVRVAGQIGSALDAAHQMNILHRDVKPNNVLLSPAGDAKLLDFGLVKDLDSPAGLTEDLASLGTPFFMAPEQFFNTKTVDSRADLYGLAATLLYALTGTLPFKFRGAGLLEKKLAKQFHPRGEMVPNVSPGIIQALSTALEPDPDRRPKTGAVLAHALRSATRHGCRPANVPAQPDQTERRSIMRRKCHFEGIGSFEGGRGEYAATIIDISTEGVCLLAECNLTPNTVLDLSFCFCDADDCWDYQIRVVYVGPKDAQPCRHGCRFLQPMDRAELLALLHERKENIQVRITRSA